MLAQDLKSVLAQAQATRRRSPAQDPMKLVGKIADLEMDGHEETIAAGREFRL
jgi:hypothetical protein